VLLLGSYPSEVSANLSLEKLDPGQPTTVQGHDFYAGRLESRRVVLGIAGQSPADTYAITELALSRFSCISAVVFEGTAGGGGESGLADVTVPSRWAEYDGQTFAHGQTSANVSAKALAVARSIAARATSELGNTAAVDDGPCACSGLLDSLKLVPTMRSPTVIVGGSGETDNTGGSDQCLAAGGMLEGCNPCPPGSTHAMVQSGVTAGATTSAAAANMASLAAQDGVLVPNAAQLLSRVTPPSPSGWRAASTQSDMASGATYIADDQQTTASMVAAQAHQVPFIAFRGISDTAAVGDLWPFEWLVYQQLAADNAAVAARLWIGAWNVPAPIVAGEQAALDAAVAPEP
jgi:nucleoside phosphorylase